MGKTISVAEFRDLCTKVLTTQGFDAEEVEACTDEFVDAQCRGINTHGASIIILYLEELPYKEIAAITGLSENHIAVKMKRIRKILLDCITPKLK